MPLHRHAMTPHVVGSMANSSFTFDPLPIRGRRSIGMAKYDSKDFRDPTLYFAQTADLTKKSVAKLVKSFGSNWKSSTVLASSATGSIAILSRNRSVPVKMRNRCIPGVKHFDDIGS